MESTSKSLNISSIKRRASNWATGLKSMFNRTNDEDRQLVDDSQNSSNRVSSSYTELNGGSVPCPSCKGSGLIPKELEGTLVALIPVNDERLKPKKTCLYIFVSTLIFVLIGALLLFLLMPRTVSLTSDGVPIEVVNVFRHNTTPSAFIDFYFTNKINVTSANFLPVDVVNVTAIIISKFDPWSSDVVGRGGNETFSQYTPLHLMRNTRELAFNNTVDLSGVVAEYCQAPFSRLTSLYVNLEFDVTVTLRYYYGHQEQVTLSTQQQVCCVPTGNCTSTD